MKENNYISKSQRQKVEAKGQKKKRKRFKKADKQSQSIVQIMNGEFLTKDFVMNNLNYIFFLIFLMILIVSKGYYVRQLANDITKEETAVDDITSDYVETKAKLEEETRRSQMVERLQPLGLKETVNPTKVIRIKEEKQK
ncbi:MAG: FtsL-like putative cell division protein [Brumimicrobium sp.]